MQKNILYLFPILAVLACVKATSNFTLPSDVQKCNVSDPNFNSCCLVLFDKLVHMGIMGIPSLGIKPLDPIFVSHICLNSAPGSPLSLNVELNNAKVFGFSNLTIFSTNGTDINKNIIMMNGIIPKMRILSNYSMEGAVMGIPLTRIGTLDVVFYNYTINYQSYHCPVMKKNHTYLAVQNMTLDTEYHGGNVAYTTDHTQKTLGINEQDIQNIVNSNLGQIYDEYEAYVNQAILSAISPSLVRFNNEVSFDELFVK